MRTKATKTINGIEFPVVFGYRAMSGSLEYQAREQGFTLGEEAGQLEAMKKALMVCSASGIATDYQVISMRRKLNKRVLKALKPVDKSQMEEEVKSENTDNS